MRPGFPVVVAGLALLVAAAGCTATSGSSGSGGAVTDTTTTATTAPTGSATATASTTTPEPTSTSPPPHAATVGGDPVTYASGLVVAVPQVARFTPSASAVGGAEGDVGVVVTVSVTNGGTQPLDPTLLTVALAYGPDQVLAASVLDAENGYGTGLSDPVAAGAEATGDYAFAVPPSGLGSLQVRVTPDLQAPETSVFSGSLP